MRPLQLLWLAGAAAVPGQPKRECWFLHGAGEIQLSLEISGAWLRFSALPAAGPEPGRWAPYTHGTGAAW